MNSKTMSLSSALRLCLLGYMLVIGVSTGNSDVDATTTTTTTTTGHRRLYGERLRGARDGMGGAAMQAKSYYAEIPMRNRINVVAPTPAPPASVGTIGVSLPVGGCTFEEEDGSMSSFESGALLTGYRELDECTNDEFPCFCLPGAPDQTICPYCQFQAASDAVVCAKHEEEVDVVFTAGMGATGCSCSAITVQDGGSFVVEMSSNCPLLGEAIQGPVVTPMPTKGPTKTPTTNPPTTKSPTGTPGPVCTFVDEDSGTLATFDHGEELGNFGALHDCVNGPASSFPCYCLPGAPDQTICPYCQFRDYFGRRFCSHHNASVSFNGPSIYFLNCGCTVDYAATGNSYGISISSNCDLINNTFAVTEAPSDTPSHTPSSAPSAPPSNLPTDQPTGKVVSTTSPSAAPTTSPSMTPSDRPSVSPTTPAPVQNSTSPASGCQFVDERFGSNVVTFSEGSSMGSYKMLSECKNGGSLDFPCYCDSKVPGQTVCPYCRFQGFNGRTLCAKDQETISFQGPTLAMKSCSCTVGTGDPDSPGGYIFTSNCDMHSMDFPHP